MTCEHCDKPVRCRGLCATHYHAWWMGRDFFYKGRQTEVCECGKPVHAKGKCSACYQRDRQARLRVSCPGRRQHDWLANGKCRRCGAVRTRWPS